MIHPFIIVGLWACSSGDKPDPGVETGDTEAPVDSADSGVDSNGGDDTSPTDDTAPPVDTYDPVVEGLEVADVRLCEAPLAEPTWTDHAEALGVTGPLQPNDLTVTDGGGMAIEDLNGDGYLDIVMVFREETPKIFRFNPETGAYDRQSLTAPEHPFSVQLADLDRNGWPDLMFGATDAPAIWFNEAGVFTRGVLPTWETENYVEELAPADIDQDGDSDLYVLMATAGHDYADDRRDFILWNDGDGTFTPDFEVLPGDSGKGVGFDAAWFDSDDDGDLDIYVGNDHGPCFGGNQLFINEGGTLTVASDTCSCDQEMAAMGVDAADWSGDGLPDLVVTDHSAWKLFQSLGDNKFVEVSLSVGMDAPAGSQETGWGAIWLDYDNDGDLDILGAMGINIFSEDDLDNPGDGVVLMNYDGTRFTDVAPEKALEAEANMRAVAAVDWNYDGVLDLFTSVVNRAPRIYLSDGCTAASWVEVFAPPGSRVEITAGDFHRVDWVTAASSLGSATVPMVHFGLGSEDLIDRIHVTWPGGETVEWSEPFEARRRIRAWPPREGASDEQPAPTWQ